MKGQELDQYFLFFLHKLEKEEVRDLADWLVLKGRGGGNQVDGRESV